MGEITVPEENHLAALQSMIEDMQMDRPALNEKKPMSDKKTNLEEDVPTNAMGASSSTPGTGAIDTYDPVLDLGGGKVKNKMRKKLFDILRRKLAEK